MLKRRIQEATPDVTSNVNIMEDNDRDGSWKKGVKRCIGAAAAGTVLFTGAGFAAGNASADRIWVGGACDVNGDGLRGTAMAQGRWAPGDETAHYPASMAPLSCADVNNTNTYDSIRIGGQQVVDFYYRHQNDPWVDAEGFSLGAGVVNWASMELARQHGGQLPWNFHPVTVGDGWSEAGVLNHPVAGIAGFVTRPLGVPTNWELHPVPGTTVRNDANDFFGTTGVGPWNIPAQINRWVQSGAYGAHRDVNPFGEPYTVVDRDGIRYEYYGPDQAFRAWEHQFMAPPPPPAEVPKEIDITSPTRTIETYNNYVRTPVESRPPARFPAYVPRIEDVPPPVPGQPLTGAQQAILDAFTASLPALP